MSPDRRARASCGGPGVRRVLGPVRRLVGGQLRLRVLLAVVSVTLVALTAFDLAAVTALRGYLLARTDTALRTAALATRPVLAAPDHMVAWVSAHPFIAGQYSLLYIPKTGIPTALEDGSPPLPETSMNIPPNHPPDLVVNGQAQTIMSGDRAGADAPVLRRCQPRAAHPAGLAARQR